MPVKSSAARSAWIAFLVLAAHAGFAAPVGDWQTAYDEGVNAYQEDECDSAVDALRRALKVAETFGQSDPRLLDTLSRLADSCQCSAKYGKDAAGYLERGLKIRAKVAAAGNERAAESLDQLGSAASSQSEYKKALDVYGDALRIREKLYPQGHEKIAGTYASIAWIYHYKNEGKQALNTFRHALELREQGGGGASEDYADLLHQYAELLAGQQDLKGSLAAYDREIAVRTGLWRPSDERFVEALYAIARRCTDHEYSDKVYQRIAAIVREEHGDSSEEYYDALTATGQFRQIKGHLAEAESSYLLALEARRKMEPDGDAAVNCLSQIAQTLQARGMHREAIVTSEEVIGILRKNQAGAAKFLAPSATLAESYARIGDFHNAERCFREIRESLAASAPYWTIRSAETLGQIYFERGAYTEAVAKYETAAAVFEAIPKHDESEMMVKLQRLQQSYHAAGREEDANRVAGRIMQLLWKNVQTNVGPDAMKKFVWGAMAFVALMGVVMFVPLLVTGYFFARNLDRSLLALPVGDPIAVPMPPLPTGAVAPPADGLSADDMHADGAMITSSDAVPMRNACASGDEAKGQGSDGPVPLSNAGSSADDAHADGAMTASSDAVPMRNACASGDEAKGQSSDGPVPLSNAGSSADDAHADGAMIASSDVVPMRNACASGDRATGQSSDGTVPLSNAASSADNTHADGAMITSSDAVPPRNPCASGDEAAGQSSDGTVPLSNAGSSADDAHADGVMITSSDAVLLRNACASGGEATGQSADGPAPLRDSTSSADDAHADGVMIASSDVALLRNAGASGDEGTGQSSDGPVPLSNAASSADDAHADGVMTASSDVVPMRNPCASGDGATGSSSTIPHHSAEPQRAPAARGEAATEECVSVPDDAAPAGPASNTDVPLVPDVIWTAPPTLAEAPFQALAFHGSGGRLFGIQIRNLLFSLLTLGIYYFWGKARTRRYVYGQSEFDGDRFAFHGTGRELLLGWLRGLPFLGFLVFFPRILPLIWASPYAPLVAAGSVLVVFAVLWPIARAGSYRYRINRMSWRGIRFSFRGSTWRYLLLSLLGYFLSAITFRVYEPFFDTRIRRFFTGQTYFGNVPFRYTGRGRDLLPSFLVAMPLTLFTFGLYWAWWSALKARYEWAHTEFAGARCRSTVTGPKLLRLYAGNLLLFACTLGIGAPWVIARTARFWTENVQVSGTPNLDTVTQEAQSVSAMGESFADFLGFDFGF